MRKFLAAAAALALAGPATAQDDVFTQELDEEVERAIPHRGEVESLGILLDQVVGAMLELPVGPIVDAVDAANPDRRYRARGPAPRTLRDVAGRDDPWFEERLRGDIREVTSGMGIAVEQAALLAPVMRRSLVEMEREIGRAMRDHERRREADRRR